MLSSLVTSQVALGRSYAPRSTHPLKAALSQRSGARNLHSSAVPQEDLNKIQQDILRRNASVSVRLGTLKPMPGSHIKEIRIGRGIGSGKGKTSTKGHKGRTARQGGNVKYGFEGGQTPFYKRMRKYGFTNKPHLREYAPLNLSRLQFWIDTGRIDVSQKITMKTLLDSGCVGRLRKLQKGIKLLGDGHEWFKAPIDIEVSQASTQAQEAITKAGGKIKLVYYNDTGLRAMLKPEKYYPYTERPLPYLTIPRANINKKLLHPMEQPEQFAGWKEAQQALKEALESTSAPGGASQSL